MTPRFDGWDAKVRASFARQDLMATFGAELTALSPGICEITAPILPLARQQQGFAHAGLTFAIGDSAGGYAALTLLEEHAEVLTAEIKINLLAPGAGERLIARGSVLKPGRRLIVVRSDVFAEGPQGTRQIAALQGTMVPTQI